MQAPNTYWSTAVSAGWYGGFGALLRQEIDNIGAANLGVLSPAICPASATGADADDALTQEQLYVTMQPLNCSHDMLSIVSDGASNDRFYLMTILGTRAWT